MALQINMTKGKRKAGPEIIVNVFGSTAKGRNSKRTRFLRFSPPPLPTSVPPTNDPAPTIDLTPLPPDDGDSAWVTEAAVDIHDMGEPSEPQAPRSRRSARTKKKSGVAVRHYSFFIHTS